MMIGSSTVPLHNVDINKAVVHPASSGTINCVASDQMLSKDFAPVKKNTSTLDSSKPAQPKAAPVEQVMPVKEAVSFRPEINKDKTYEQCEREALERIYEEVNKMLDEVVDGCEEQF